MNTEDYIHVDRWAEDIQERDNKIKELLEIIESYQVDEQHYVQTLERMEKRITFLEDDNRFLEALNLRRTA
jgi:predicted transcriptional regulator